MGVLEIGDEYVVELAARDPLTAYVIGETTSIEALPDFSPDGLADRAAAASAALRRLAAQHPDTVAEQRAYNVIEHTLMNAVQDWESGDALRSVRIHFTPQQAVHDVAAMLPCESAADAESAVAYLAAVPGAVAGMTEALREGLRRGLSASRRQALTCAQQADSWGSTEGAFGRLAERCRPFLSPAATRNIDDVREQAAVSYRELGSYLRDEYAPHAEERDPVGRDRYQRAAAAFLGCDINPEATYEWGWAEVERVSRELRTESARIDSGSTPLEVMRDLDHYSRHVVHGRDKALRWLQDVADQAIAALDGTVIDLPPAARRLEVVLAPSGGPQMPVYVAPSEDFTRPGRITYPSPRDECFPTWAEKTVVYHEGVPGHHAQECAAISAPPGTISRFQRLLGFSPGHGEGWALYAEGLMDELGYFDDPAERLGMLRASLLRAVRVVLDIGLHLELPCRGVAGVDPNTPWDAALAANFLSAQTAYPDQRVLDEVNRYLGVPGQSICYRIGEAVWRRVRRSAESAAGSAFDLRAFHATALGIGPMGLAAFERDPAFKTAAYAQGVAQ